MLVGVIRRTGIYFPSQDHADVADARLHNGDVLVVVVDSVLRSCLDEVAGSGVPWRG